MAQVIVPVVCLCFWVVVYSHPYTPHEEAVMHPISFNGEQQLTSDKRASLSRENTAQFWNDQATDTLKEFLKIKLNTNKAKNVIFFLGDGMSIPTLTAARVYAGQLKGKSGEEEQLSFEMFPVTGLSKTYCVDKQVSDSACTATAYLSGVKTNLATIGVTGKVPLRSCKLMQDKSNHVHSIAKSFIDVGRSAGIVTTTRVTHASPAGAYAHTAHRDWENDGAIRKEGFDPTLCPDIAHQLVHGDPGQHFKVILGGGRREFLPNTTVDEEESEGLRWDERNLIDEWKTTKSLKNETYTYIWNREQLQNIDANTDNVLGLFESSHCKYHLEADVTTEPTLEEMVEAAIMILSKNNNGYFLFAEGGRIDHAHHESLARIALDETVEFSKAIARAVELTSTEDTLIVVSSDHAHTMSFSGYPSRGNDILGAVDQHLAEDNLPYLTLSYANGLGYRKEVDGERVDVTKEDMENIDFHYPATVPLDSETHGGDDVAVFALGPWQHLFTGTYEQNTIPHIMAYASCINPDLSACSAASSVTIISLLTLLASSVTVFLPYLIMR